METFTKAAQFLREVKMEIKKVTWPSRSHTINSTIVVLITTAIITTFLYLCDLGFGRVISRLIK